MRTMTAEQLRTEAEDMRREADELRDRLRRHEAAEEGRRAEDRRRAHPSNRLCRGEIRSFREAMAAHVECLRREAARWVDCSDDPEAPEALKGDPWPGWIAEAQAALAEYDANVGAAERALADRWVREPDGSIKRLVAAALVSGDYSALAI
jgi:hypothetical protein